MANPALNEKSFSRIVPPRATQAGWAAPTGQGTGQWVPPSGDIASPWVSSESETMTVEGSVTATAVLLVLLCVTGVVGWNLIDVNPLGQVEMPGWLFVPLLVALGLAIATVVKPAWARITAPLYALSEGLFLGAVSALYEIAYDGIVLQAVVCSIGVLGLMLFLHVTRIIKVTDKFRMIVVCATGAIAIAYLFNFVLRLFGTELPFIHESSGIGIAVSVGVVIVAALNLSLDFDFIERGVRARAPKSTEWYAAFGLLLTLVWLYLELLRLLAKLNRR